MRKAGKKSMRLLSMLTAFVLAFAALPALPAAYANPQIVIDGSTSDWSSVPAAATNASGDVNSVKVTNDDGQLFILAQGSNFAYTNEVHVYVFLDTDNNTATGINASPWNTDGALNGSDYMIDNGRLYKYVGPGWDWEDLNYAPLSERSSNLIEMYVPLGLLGLEPGDTLNIGVQRTRFTLDGNGNVISSSITGAAPAGGNNLAQVTLNPASSPSAPNWSGIPAAVTGSGAVSSVKVKSDAANLYFHAEGTGLSSASFVSFFINADNNVATGYYATGWLAAGADYLIENGYLYAYTSTTSNTAWSWSATPVAVDWSVTSTAVDVKVPLWRLGLGPGSTFRFGVILDNSSVNRAPDENDPLPAVTLEQPYLPALAPTAVPWEDIRDFVVQYTIEDDFDYDLFDDYEAVILDGGDAITRLSVTKAKNNRPASYIIGYVSIGETLGLLTDLSGQPLDIYFLDSGGNPIMDVNWPGSYYVDPRKPLWQDMILNQYLPKLYARGFDGVFLDLVDIVTIYDPSNGLDFTVAQQAMADLIKEMKEKYPDKKVIVNGGAVLLHGGTKDISEVIDGFMVESLSATWASPEIDPNTGAFLEWYHLHPTDSYDYLWGERLAYHLNQIRFEYDEYGEVERDEENGPVKSDRFFHVFALDYVKDGSTAANILMMDEAVIRSWDKAFLPAVEPKELWLPIYNWLDTIETDLLTEPNWGLDLDVPYMPNSGSTLESFGYGVDNWRAFRGGVLPSSEDSVSLTASSGAAKLSFTVRGDVAANGTTNEIIVRKNAAGMVSNEWITPLDFTGKVLQFDVKISSPLPSDKAFEIELRDENGDFKVWRNPVTLTSSYQTVTLDPAGDPGYRPGTLGARDGFQADKVKSIEFRIVNTVDGGSDFTADLYIDNIKKVNP